MSIGENNDITAIIGNSKIGYMGYNDWTGFSHRSKASQGNFALMQKSTGQTVLNASSGESISLSINNSDKMILKSDGSTHINGMFHVNGGRLYCKETSTNGVIVIGDNSDQTLFDNYLFFRTYRADQLRMIRLLILKK